ncbi:hypothetical protein FRC02_012406 [Tulasnella sp. 418]|nr:hypothetical protein FRC02_012406 [Tulasnella sp. 418]
MPDDLFRGSNIMRWSNLELVSEGYAIVGRCRNFITTTCGSKPVVIPNNAYDKTFDVLIYWQVCSPIKSSASSLNKAARYEDSFEARSLPLVRLVATIAILNKGQSRLGNRW